MNTFNRIVVVILLLLSLVLLPTFFLFPREFLANYINTLMNLGQVLDNINPTLRLGVGVALALLSFLLCLLLLTLELWPVKPGTVKVSRADKGEILLELNSMAGRIQQAVAQIPSVVDVKPSVRKKGQGVAIDLAIITTPEVNVPEKSAEVLEAVKRLVESDIGVKLAHIRIKLKHVKAPVTVRK